MENIYDVAIIGSGPAGAAAAYELAKQNIKTIIIEKEKLPRYKTCGGGFVYRGLKNMPFDVSSAIERKFYEVEIIFGKKNLDFVTKRKNPIISMIMRDSFDHLMVKEAEKLGITILQEAKLTNLIFKDTTTNIETTKGTIEAKIIIAADGALSPTAKLAGWEETRMMCPALEYEIKVPQEDFKRLSKKVRFDIDVVPYGYGWCFPKRNHLSVGVGNFMKNNLKVNLKKDYQDYLQTLGIQTVLDEEAHGFIIPISPRKDGFVKKNVFLVGDAAGFADPITAEGISNAIYSGRLAANAIAENKLNIEKAGFSYHQKLDKKLIKEIEIGIKLSKLFYGQRQLRNLLLIKYGQRAAEYMTDIFMGDRTYPADIKKKVKKRIGISI
ncbi:geranylgeranyl reductase family protein [Mesonia sp. K7]|uniref:geranylgeranyl reductase family protein n=1 Tax=Mesonia sp. K7 TaxID=2218606 RepID=UPI000DA9C6EE|nr:geranylgeranyl reductase family protein [Mesonia sp. K7]PZD79644.1 geranylgeranyl reductase [Mesonia sp. K7]